ncbi:hypothetical protein HZB07_05715 [Candidatus Saganbacteria bacterium]|nr:hypothetical protein [Candidatus Saganbacteria bacterium]
MSNIDQTKLQIYLDSFVGFKDKRHRRIFNETILLLCLSVLSFLSSFVPVAFAQPDYESLKQINETNWVKWFDETLGYIYDSHGCLHFTPADIALLSKTIPPNLPLTIKKYQLKENDPPFNPDKIPLLIDTINTPQDIAKQALTFKNYPTELVAYPSLDLLVIMVNGSPYARVRTLAGPPQDYLMAFEVEKDQPIVWDSVLTTATDPGQYQLLRWTDHYLSHTYYQNTIVPFGAWIKKTNRQWFYEEKGRWYKLPKHIVTDLNQPFAQRQYNYYDINVDDNGQISAARYAGHDFGKYALLWTADGQTRYPELAYAAGQLIYEQIILLKDLVHLLTVPTDDDLDSVSAQNENFSFYRQLYEFKTSRGKQQPLKVDRALLAAYKIFNDFSLSHDDRSYLDDRLVKALGEYRENRLPRGQRARWEALGLYNYLRMNSLIVDKQAGWYERVKRDWDQFKILRQKLRADFDRMGVLSLENRQNLVENWLNERLEFKSIAPPKEAKNITPLSFAAFFRPDDASRLFDEREKMVMVEKLKKSTAGEKGLNLAVVDALNNYNFGVLLNDILGDLYKSHGCMHVSPRNITFVSELLPLGAAVKIHRYSERLSVEALAQVPYLADLVNFADDLAKLKQQFAATADVQVAVYPYSGDWLIFLKEQPLARLTIRGGPQTKFYLVQGRDKEGAPIFEPHLAYPTTPGNYWIFKKLDNYVSNIYRDQTIVPQGSVIKWVKEKEKWIFQDDTGNWKELPGVLMADLKQPEDKREYTYYDVVKNSSGEVISLRWGSQPFGRYPLQITADKRYPWPELVHTSGDLMMEERQLVNELIKILTAPSDNLDDCLPYSPSFPLYKACHEFVANPNRTDLIQPRERAAYRLYFGLPLTVSEEALLPLDVRAANKALHGRELTDQELKTLLKEGIAYRRSGQVKLNMEKILGLQFDTYQYVVTIQKYSHHYEVLQKRWPELTNLRVALLKDFNNFVLKDQNIFHNFMRELMLKRNQLERLTQEDALRILSGMLTKT